MEQIPDEVARQLGWYVYRLIDPRNGETFYVGKGTGQRLYQHVQEARALADENAGIDDDVEDALDLKVQRIQDIHAAGLEVDHVVHRHGIKSEEVALQIEAALIDAYPGLQNRIGGHGSGAYGCRHIKEIIREYHMDEFTVNEPLLLIAVNNSIRERNVYDAVRGVWKLSRNRVDNYKLVLAHDRGVVIGAFRPTSWFDATQENFPWLSKDIPGRIGFDGVEAPSDVRDRYVNHRVPQGLRARGAANPCRYVDPA